MRAILFVVCLVTTSFLRASDGLPEKDILLLGQSADFHGPLASTGLALKDGAEVYFNSVNAAGGIKGKKIKVISLDDSYEGERTLENTIDLIQNKKVFALFNYVGTPNLVEALPAIQKFSPSGIFLFANFTGAQPQREPPHNQYVYNVRTSYREETAGIVDHLVKMGKKRIALFIQYDAYGRAGASGVARQLTRHHLEVVAETTYPRGINRTNRMIEQINAIKKANADAVIAVAVADASVAFIRDARLMGLTVPIANLSPDSTDLLSYLLSEEKKYSIDLTYKLISSQVVPPINDESYPLVKEFKKAMMSAGKTVNSASLEGYLNAKVFVDVLKRIKGDITRENFKKAAAHIKNLDVGLKEEKADFTNEAHQALRAVYFTTIETDKYVIIKDWNKLK